MADREQDTEPLRLTNGKEVFVKYMQWVEGIAMVKSTDGEAHYLGEFTCTKQFTKLCDDFNLWDCRRDNPIQEAPSS